MHKLSKSILFLPLLMGSAALLGGCDSNEEVRVLRVLNCEDYIYEYEEGDEENATEGKNWYKEDVMDQFVDYWAETHDGEEIDYVYDTFDTNETMFNELKTGKTSYDVIVPSDYMIQKLISQDMLHKISDENKTDLWSNISGYLKNEFDSIKAIYENEDKTIHEEHTLSEYSVPYMWGTVGLMYNPKYYTENSGLTEEEVHELFMDWDSLYTNEAIKGTYSIKDSVRDTYAVSLIHTYREEIAGLTDAQIESGVLGEIFNRHDEKQMAEVKADMLKLKESAFGFECDSGKTDMVDQKVGANMCWSGDATWAITEARDEDDEENNLDLYYSIPTGVDGKGASNIWFDGLCMPKNTDHEDNLSEDEKAQYELAEEFIKFMSTPEIAAQNCYCVGYTPGVAGDAMLDYMLGEYDITEDLPEYPVEGEDYVNYDLTYFFDYDSYKSGVSTIIFKVDPDAAKRELAAQYPEQSILNRLAVMKDFGTEGNAALLNMWEQVRTNALPLWGIIVLAVEGVTVIAFVSYMLVKKSQRKKDKKDRIKTA